jgi:hypothetical protein
MGYLVDSPIKKYSRRLDFTELSNLINPQTCFSGDIFINNLFIGAKFEMFADTLNNFNTLSIVKIGSTDYIGQYEEINGSIAGNTYCLFGNILNSPTGFGFNSANLPSNSIGLVTTTTPALSNPLAFAILTIYLTQ